MSREKLAENIISFLPMLYKKIVKGFPPSEIPKQQVGLLFHIKREGSKPMSHYSEVMMIPKSNLTVLSDKMIEEGLIEREYDAADRRVINLRITEKGEKCLYEYRETARALLAEKLAGLGDEDVERLNGLFVEMRELFDRIKDI